MIHKSKHPHILCFAEVTEVSRSKLTLHSQAGVNGHTVSGSDSSFTAELCSETPLRCGRCPRASPSVTLPAVNTLGDSVPFQRATEFAAVRIAPLHSPPFKFQQLRTLEGKLRGRPNTDAHRYANAGMSVFFF